MQEAGFRLDDRLRARADGAGRVVLTIMRTTRLRVTLREVAPPPGVRVIDVPASSTLPELHMLLRAAVGGTDSHLYQFVAGDIRYGVPSEDGWDDRERDEVAASLKELLAKFLYPVRLRRRVGARRRDPGLGRRAAGLPVRARRLPAGGLRRSGGLRAAAGGSR